MTLIFKRAGHKPYCGDWRSSRGWWAIHPGKMMNEIYWMRKLDVRKGDSVLILIAEESCCDRE